MEQFEMQGPISTRVVIAVADETGVEHTDLPPLNDAIDPDALDALFGESATRTGSPEGDCEVTFTYAGVDVRVRDDRITVIQPTPSVDTRVESLS